MHTDTPRATSVRRRKDESRVFQRADGMWTGSVELPSINGRRRQRRVYSSDRDEAMRKLSALQEAVATGELA